MTGDTDIVYRELNTRWLRLFSTVTPFTGRACSFTALICHRDACLRAKTILEEYDRFEVRFPESLALKRVIQAMRRDIPAFLEAFPQSIQHLMGLYWNRFRCLWHYTFRLHRATKDSKVRPDSCLRKLETYFIACRQLAVLGEQYGLALNCKLTIMDASLNKLRSMRIL